MLILVDAVHLTLDEDGIILDACMRLLRSGKLAMRDHDILNAIIRDLVADCADITLVELADLIDMAERFDERLHLRDDGTRRPRMGIDRLRDERRRLHAAALRRNPVRMNGSRAPGVPPWELGRSSRTHHRASAPLLTHHPV